MKNKTAPYFYVENERKLAGDMITEKTVLILGAGASRPYGFPTGDELRQMILKATKPVSLQTQQTYDLLGDMGFLGDKIKDFRKEYLQDQISIDAFLENNEEFMGIGKALIAHCLLPCESYMNLYEYEETGLAQSIPYLADKPGEVEKRLDGPWYKLLFERLTVNTSFEELLNNKVSYITFNYDRSLEYYLYTSLSSHYKNEYSSKKEFDEIFKQIPIVYVYGNLGSLLPDKDGGKVSYGSSNIDVDIVRTSASKIDLIRKGNSDSYSLKKAFELLSDPEVLHIYFLGFGFDSENMKRLKLDKIINPVILSVGGTKFNLPIDRINEVNKTRVTGQTTPRVYIELDEATVFDFLYNYEQLV